MIDGTLNIQMMVVTILLPMMSAIKLLSIPTLMMAVDEDCSDEGSHAGYDEGSD